MVATSFFLGCKQSGINYLLVGFSSAFSTQYRMPMESTHYKENGDIFGGVIKSTVKGWYWLSVS